MYPLRLLDLFCKAGGAAAGYHRVGFDVVGIDIDPQPRYPFAFIQADAFDYLRTHGKDFDVIHASPPCQAYSCLQHLPWLAGRDHPRLIEPLRELLVKTGKPYVIENVPGSGLSGITLCGYTLGLLVYRHRIFESSHLLLAPPHKPHKVVIGRGRGVNDRKKGSLNNNSATGAWGN